MMKHWGQIILRLKSLRIFMPYAQEYREKMLESLADFDDKIMEKYLDRRRD